MANLVLQHIILPHKEDERMPLFVREKNLHGVHGNQCELSFDTYFNSFVWRKWKKYTRLDNLWLNVEASGKFILEIIALDEDNKETVITRAYPNQGKKLKIGIEAPEDCILVYHKFLYDDTAQFIYGDSFYSTDLDDISLVNVLGITTTFRREVYLKRNVKAIQGAREKENILKEHFSLLIVDNDSSLDRDKYEEPGVRLVHNPNVGGSGGFARGMLEALDTPSLQYIVVMDDDIELDPETLYRTITFLSLLKSQYSGYFLGAAMFTLEKKCVQHVWQEYLSLTNYTFRSLYSDMEMDEPENMLISSLHDSCPLGYNGWWYCAMPVEVIRRNGLPLPIFFKYDDVEYGIRNGSRTILMNGICVWHEDFEKKENLLPHFFEERNRVIFMFMHKPSFVMYLRFLGGMTLRSLQASARYNYGYFDACSEVFKSLRKGTDGLSTNLVTSEFLGKLNACNPERHTDKEGYLFYSGYLHSRETPKDRGSFFLTLLSRLTAAGHILPAHLYSGKFIYSEREPLSRSLFSREIVQVHEKGKFYEKREIAPAKFWKSLSNYGLQCFLALLAYPRLKRDFQKNGHTLKDQRFWRKYLGMQERVNA